MNDAHLRRTVVVASAPSNPGIDSLRTDAWDYALHAAGTSYSFDVRARRLKTKIKWMAFAGIATPLWLAACRYPAFLSHHEFCRGSSWRLASLASHC